MLGAVGRIVVLLALIVLPVGPGARVEAKVDRLERFRELVGLLDPSTAEEPASVETLHPIYALLDAEIIESLTSGGVFATPAFIRDRLEAFTETWGGVTMRLVSLGRLLIVAYQFSETPLGSSVRIYGGRAREEKVLAVLAGPGWPNIRPLSSGVSGAAPFLVVWEGPPLAHGARPLRVDLVREGDGSVRATWSSADAFPDGLTAQWYAVRGSDLTVRHPAYYPGWSPGCDQQTEHEDLYRLAPNGMRFARVSRRAINAWHRDLHATAARLFEALAADDPAALTRLVRDPALRARLPRTLRSEPACDSRPGSDGTVSIAARAASRQPWTLTFRGKGKGDWQLTAAMPTIR
ncbi:MAG: hypothetical protein ACREKS_13860 [Candidatus Rokuibacteriota bacterium]